MMRHIILLFIALLVLVYSDSSSQKLLNALMSIRGEDLHFKHAHDHDHEHAVVEIPSSMSESLKSLEIPEIDAVAIDSNTRKISIEILTLAPPGTNSRLSRAAVTPEHESRVGSLRAMLDKASEILETPLHTTSDTYPYRSRMVGKKGYGLRTVMVVMPDYLIAHGDHFHRSSDMEQDAGRVLLILVAALLVTQYAVNHAQRKFPWAYEVFQTVTLWVLPAVLALRAGFSRFVVVWTAFLLLHVAIFVIARRSADWSEAPRLVYLLFLQSHRACFLLAAAGAAALALALVSLWVVVAFTPPTVMAAEAAAAAAPRSLGWPESLFLAGAHMLFYGVYLGIVCRDSAHLIIADLLRHLHARRGFGTGSGALQSAHADSCSICLRALAGDAAEGQESADSLRVARPALDRPKPTPAMGPRVVALLRQLWGAASASASGAGEGEGGEEAADEEVQRLRGDGDAEPTYALKCGHRFHDACLRGWMLVGKHDTCASCGERCALRDRFTTPWERFAAAHSGGLDMVRRVLVWNPLLVLVMDRALVLFY